MLSLLPVCGSDNPRFLCPMLFDVLLDVDISGFLKVGFDFLLEYPPNLLSFDDPENDFFDGLGGGIKARAEICL